MLLTLSEFGPEELERRSADVEARTRQLEKQAENLAVENYRHLVRSTVRLEQLQKEIAELIGNFEREQTNIKKSPASGPLAAAEAAWSNYWQRCAEQATISESQNLLCRCLLSENILTQSFEAENWLTFLDVLGDLELVSQNLRQRRLVGEAQFQKAQAWRKRATTLLLTRLPQRNLQAKRAEIEGHVPSFREEFSLAGICEIIPRLSCLYQLVFGNSTRMPESLEGILSDDAPAACKDLLRSFSRHPQPSVVATQKLLFYKCVQYWAQIRRAALMEGLGQNLAGNVALLTDCISDELDALNLIKLVEEALKGASPIAAGGGDDSKGIEPQVSSSGQEANDATSHNDPGTLDQSDIAETQAANCQYWQAMGAFIIAAVDQGLRIDESVLRIQDLWTSPAEPEARIREAASMPRILPAVLLNLWAQESATMNDTIVPLQGSLAQGHPSWLLLVRPSLIRACFLRITAVLQTANATFPDDLEAAFNPRHPSYQPVTSGLEIEYAVIPTTIAEIDENLKVLQRVPALALWLNAHSQLLSETSRFAAPQAESLQLEIVDAVCSAFEHSSRAVLLSFAAICQRMLRDPSVDRRTQDICRYVSEAMGLYLIPTLVGMERIFEKHHARSRVSQQRQDLQLAQLTTFMDQTLLVPGEANPFALRIRNGTEILEAPSEECPAFTKNSPEETIVSPHGDSS